MTCWRSDARTPWRCTSSARPRTSASSSRTPWPRPGRAPARRASSCSRLRLRYRLSWTPSDCRQALDNLLDNAVRHARSEVRVELACEAECELVLGVEDDGPGIDRHAPAAPLRRVRPGLRRRRSLRHGTLDGARRRGGARRRRDRRRCTAPRRALHGATAAGAGRNRRLVIRFGLLDRLRDRWLAATGLALA